jgi:hypothetical protein
MLAFLFFRLAYFTVGSRRRIKIFNRGLSRIKIMRLRNTELKFFFFMRRLVCVDASRESAACLACVYLNEYRTAVAAFTLHAAELKIVRVSEPVVFAL